MIAIFHSFNNKNKTKQNKTKQKLPRQTKRTDLVEGVAISQFEVGTEFKFTKSRSLSTGTSHLHRLDVDLYPLACRAPSSGQQTPLGLGTLFAHQGPAVLGCNKDPDAMSEGHGDYISHVRRDLTCRLSLVLQ